MQLLLRSGASANLPDSDGGTALHAAVEVGSEVCRLLLQHRANVNAVGKGGVAPLHLAVRRGSLTILRLLLSNGADVHRLDDCQRSPLHIACSAPQVKEALVDLLLAAGAAVDEADGRGCTPFLHLLQSSKFTARMVRAFIERGVRLNLQQTASGKAPLHRIVLSRSPHRLECLQLLLQQPSVDLNALTAKKQTALHLSVAVGDTGCARALLRAGADPQLADRLGMTPLGLVVALLGSRSGAGGSTKMLELLLRAGLRPRLPMAARAKFSESEPETLAEAFAAPPKLSELCRAAVWRCVRPPALEGLKELGGRGEVPLSLVPFLLLED